MCADHPGWDKYQNRPGPKTKKENDMEINLPDAQVLEIQEKEINRLRAELASLYKVLKDSGMLAVAEEMLRRERDTALMSFKAKSREDKMFKS
jgi:hypothetical protein